MPREYQIGDFARNVESRGVGKIVGFERHNGELMAAMVGPDFLVAHAVNGMTLEEALTPDDIQWHAPADLELLRAAE
jgi:hypothetical protein